MTSSDFFFVYFILFFLIHILSLAMTSAGITSSNIRAEVEATHRRSYIVIFTFYISNNY